MKINHTTIMWKEILLMWIGIALLVVLLQLLAAFCYRRSILALRNSRLRSERFVRFSRGLCGLFCLNPRNRRFRLMHANLGCALASYALLQKNDSEFLSELSELRYGSEYAFRSFLLAIYFLSRNDSASAQTWVESFFNCSDREHDQEIVLGFLIGRSDVGREQAEEASKRFQNPAVKMMLAELGFDPKRL